MFNALVRLIVITGTLLSTTIISRADAKVQSKNMFPLLTAIDADDAVEVGRLIKAEPGLLQITFDAFGRTPLHVAGFKDRRKCAEVLLAAGADFYAPDANGQLPLDIAPGKKMNETTKYLRDINTERNKFLDKVTAGDKDEVDRLLKVDPTLAKAIDIGSGSTGLLLACFKGYEGIAKSLIESGADVNKLEWSTGTDALYWSIESNHPACTKLLLDNGADIERMWDLKYGELPMKMNALHYASWKGKTDMVQMLLEHGAKLNVRAISYAVFTPLHLAATDGHAEIVKLLLEHGANATALDGRRGITAVEMAERGKYDAVVKVLADFTATKP